MGALLAGNERKVLAPWLYHPSHSLIMSFTNQERSSPVGAQLIGAAPIDRPLAHRCPQEADTEIYQPQPVLSS